MTATLIWVDECTEITPEQIKLILQTHPPRPRFGFGKFVGVDDDFLPLRLLGMEKPPPYTYSILDIPHEPQDDS